MAHAFADQLREARLERRRLAVAADLGRHARDLVPTALREHRHVMQQDLRHALRMLAANPGFTAVAVLSLALGIGANTAIFSLLNSVLMSTLPVRDPHELVMLTESGCGGVSIGTEDGERSLAHLRRVPAAAGRDDSVRVGDGVEQQPAAHRGAHRRRRAGGDRSRLVSGSYFATLGVPALSGRRSRRRRAAPKGRRRTR